MPTPDEATVRAVLQTNDRDIRCREAIEQGWNHCQSLSDRAWWRRKSTTAAIMWEHSIANAVEALDGDAGARVIAHQDTTSFIFDDTVFLRFKRAGLSLMSSNYPTRLADLFHAHTGDLFGLRAIIASRSSMSSTDSRLRSTGSGVVARDKKELTLAVRAAPWRRGSHPRFLRRNGRRLRQTPCCAPAKPGDERRDAEEK